MDKEEFINLMPGDIIQNTGTGNAYVVVWVDRNYNNVICVRTIAAFNPHEWNLVAFSTGAKRDRIEAKP